MKFDRFAGMASAVGIVWTLTMIAWLGLWGPVDLSKVQPWQPLIVGLLAIVTAIIAYHGATAGVRLSRKSLERNERRRKLGIYLRAEHTCNQLSDRARSLSEKTRECHFGNRTVYLDELKVVTEAPDLAEAWANLELFPPQAAFRFSQVQSCIRTLSNFVASQPPETSWEIGPTVPYSAQMKVTNDLAHDLRRACDDVLAEIQPIVLAMSEEEHS